MASSTSSTAPAPPPRPQRRGTAATAAALPHPSYVPPPDQSMLQGEEVDPLAIQFWRLQRLQATTQTPGAYLAPSVFVPVAVWRQDGVKLAAAHSKLNELNKLVVAFKQLHQWIQPSHEALSALVRSPARFQAVAIKFSRAVAAIHSAWHSAGLVDGSGAWDMAAVPHEGGSDDTGDDGGSSVSGSSSVGGDSEGPRGSPASSPSTSPQLGRGGGGVGDTTASVAASSVVSSAGKAAARFGSSVFSMVKRASKVAVARFNEAVTVRVLTAEELAGYSGLVSRVCADADVLHRFLSVARTGPHAATERARSRRRAESAGSAGAGRSEVVTGSVQGASAGAGGGAGAGAGATAAASVVGLASSDAAKQEDAEVAAWAGLTRSLLREDKRSREALHDAIALITGPIADVMLRDVVMLTTRHIAAQSKAAMVVEKPAVEVVR